jgi:hypothetical protein
VVGKLLDGAMTDADTPKAVSIRLSGADTANAHFVYTDNGKGGKSYKLFNSSAKDNDNLSLVFPAYGDHIGPSTLFVPPMSTHDLTKPFSTYPQLGDASEFELSSGVLAVDKAIEGAGGDITVSSIGYNIPVDGKTELPIGAYVSVKVAPDSITVINESSGSKLTSVPLLTVTGVSDTKIKLSNQPVQSGDTVTISLPSELKSAVVNVNVTVALSNGNAIVKEYCDKAVSSGELKRMNREECAALLKSIGWD